MYNIYGDITQVRGLMTVIENFFFSVEKVDQREGFSVRDLVERASQVKDFERRIQALYDKGFRYGGDTKSDSKAYTDFDLKTIFIGKLKTTEEACLSLFYEITNAENKERFDELFETYFSDRDDSQERAHQYASDILRVESDAMFQKCQIAELMQLQQMIKNPKYLEIYHKNKENAERSKDLMHDEMIVNGKVQNGTKVALEHYKQQFFEQQRMLGKRSRISKDHIG